MYKISDDEFLDIINNKEMIIKPINDDKNLIVTFDASERFTGIGKGNEPFTQAWILTEEKGHLADKEIIFEFANDLYRREAKDLVRKYSGSKISIELATFLSILEKIIQDPNDWKRFDDIKGSPMLREIAESNVEDQGRKSNGGEIIRYKSNDHIRYEDGENVSGHNKGCERELRISKDENEKYSVSIHNLDGNHPLWGNDVQMAPKQMEIKRKESDKIVMRGFGKDEMGEEFSNYGITIHTKGETDNISDVNVEKIVLHMHDRNVDIEYLQSDI